MGVAVSSVLGSLWSRTLDHCYSRPPLLKILHYSLWNLPPTQSIFPLKYQDQKKEKCKFWSSFSELKPDPPAITMAEKNISSICDDFIPPLVVKLPLGVWLSQRSIIRKSQETGSHRDNLIFRKNFFVNLAEKWMCGWVSVFVHSENVCCLCKYAILCLQLSVFLPFTVHQGN